MATDYRVILLDEFDWEYVGHSKTMTVATLEKAGFEKVAEAYGLLVLECRWHPQDELIKLNNPRGITYDQAYIQVIPSGELKRIDI